MTLRSTAATLIAAVLVATGLGAGWLVISSGVLSAPPPASGATSAEVALPDQQVEAPSEEGVLVTGAFQISQPRDPFRPLITEDSPLGIPGVGGQPGDGGFTPIGTTVTLEAIRDVGGVLRATVVVNGTSYDVGVGDTFAGSYKVISLSTDRGVFTFGDNAFELRVGQQILK